jgi:hypothetical protein
MKGTTGEHWYLVYSFHRGIGEERHAVPLLASEAESAIAEANEMLANLKGGSAENISVRHEYNL